MWDVIDATLIAALIGLAFGLLCWATMEPTRTAGSVVREIADGLEDGSVTLEEMDDALES